MDLLVIILDECKTGSEYPGGKSNLGLWCNAQAAAMNFPKGAQSAGGAGYMCPLVATYVTSMSHTCHWGCWKLGDKLHMSVWNS